MAINPDEICRMAKMPYYSVNEEEKRVCVRDIKPVADFLGKELGKGAVGFVAYGYYWKQGTEDIEGGW